LQNIYDDQQFFDGYQQLRAAGRGLHETTIRPALADLLPQLAGMRVVDVGCGDGWLCRLAAEAGASDVIGIDPSRRMLGLARVETADERITYRRGFIESIQVDAGWADVVVSILALHYVADLRSAVARIAGWLTAGGTAVAVLEHPIFLAPVPDRGFAGTAGGRRAWLLHSYADEGVREEEWILPGVVKYHRTVASIVNAVVGAGLVIERVVEPLPDRDLLDEEEIADAEARPSVIGVRARKPMQI
jgi:2-polyprenyl-3-methyl-5-hydroxy-6-metoxy-1,4-benzoquinol methylase